MHYFYDRIKVVLTSVMYRVIDYLSGPSPMYCTEPDSTVAIGDTVNVLGFMLVNQRKTWYVHRRILNSVHQNRGNKATAPTSYFTVLML